MSSDLPILEIPQPAVWGTDSGVALGPHDSGGPSYTQMAAGWTVGTRPPARWMNWLQKSAGGMQRAVLGGVLADWALAVDGFPVVSVAHGIIYHPSPGDGTPGLFGVEDHRVANSDDRSVSWSGATALTGGTLDSRQNSLAIDANNILFGYGTNVYYKNSIDWSSGVSNEATTLAGNITAVATRYREGIAYALAADDLADVSYRPNGVGGATAWAASSTAPKDVGSWDGSPIEDLINITGSTWLALTEEGQIFRSTNSGFTWALYATLPGAGASARFKSLARCPHTGTLVVTHRIVSVGAQPPIYSDDNGLNWTAGSLEAPLAGTGAGWANVRGVGGGAFVALANAAADHESIWRSVDRGRTWYPGMRQLASVDVPVGVACDGTRVYVLGNGGDVYYCRALDASGLPAL